MDNSNNLSSPPPPPLRARRALSFGFGGKLITSLQHQVTLHDLREQSSALDPENMARFAPLLDSPDMSSVSVEDLALDLSTRSFPTSVEDGALPGTASLLFDCIGALLLSLAPSSSSQQQQHLFEKRVLALLTDELEQEELQSQLQYVAPRHNRSDAAQEQELAQYLVNGDQEQAVLFAVKREMWPEALLLAHFMSAAMHRRVACEYAKSTSTSSAVMRIALQLFSGRGVDAIAAESADIIARNWKHLVCLLLRNRSPGDAAVLVQLGDRLWKDCRAASAAHICYLLAQSTQKVLLFGGDHIHGIRSAFATPGSVIRTEAVFFSKRRRNSSANGATAEEEAEFQPFRLMFAMWLADLGFVEEAKQWVASIRRGTGTSMGSQGGAFEEQLDIFEARLEGSRFQPAETAEIAPMQQQRIDFEIPPTPVQEQYVPPVLLAPYQDEIVEATTQIKPASAAAEEEAKPAATSDPFASKPTTTTAGASSDPFAPKPTAGASSDPFSKPVFGGSHLHRGGGSAFTPKRNLFAPVAIEQQQKPAAPSSPKAAPSTTTADAPPPPVAAAAAPRRAPPPTGSSSSWKSSIRDWLIQRFAPLPKNAVVAKTGEPLSAYYDETAKRWIFPGEDANALASAGPPPLPPTSTTTSKT